MPRLARFFVFALLLGGFSGTGCGPGGTNGTGVGDGDDDGGNGGNGRGGASSGSGGTIFIDNCGNSVLNMDEECDDGNKNSGDGCSTQCKREGNAVCTRPGEVCVPAPVCGDGILSRTEACDEGQMRTEGCSADCTMVTPGWQCRVGGKPCVPLCGDGQLKGSENCDPPQPGMGCSTTCLSEPGWSCTGSPSVCVASVCGNGVVEAGESCDDGRDPTTGKVNGLFTGDAMEAARGCSKTCTKEPACRDATGTHACASVCGDGNVDMGEACDDGNAVSGDGCSAMCMLEAGFTCADMARPDTEPCTLSAAGECLRMPVTYRDFDGQNVASGHPDFFFLGSTPAGGTKVTCVPNASGRPVGMNGGCWDSDATPLCTGIAGATLGANGKPTLGATTSCPCRFTDWDNSGILTGVAGTTTCTSGAATPTRIETMTKVVQSAQSFAQWYTDSALGTKVIDFLELGVLGTGGYQFSSSTGRTVYEDLHDIFMGTAIPARAAQSPIFADAPANTLSSGFFPLEGRTGAHAAKMCNLWPYWPAALTTANCLANDGNPVWQQWDPQGSYTARMAGTGGPIKPVTGVARNFYFSSEVRYLFKYAGNETLAFYGDDDVWVFINGRLVLDLGAPHERLQGTVTLAGGAATYTIQTTNFVMGVPTTVMIGTGMVPNLGLEVGRTYEIVVFHADRHPRESNYQLSLSGFSTTRTSCQPRCGDAVRTGGEECDCGDAGSPPPPECMQNNADGVYGGCTAMCKYGPFCGDRNVDMPQEQCDNGPENGAAYGAKGACTSGCLLAPYCGDAIIDPPFEECDKGEGMNGAMGADCDSMCKRIIL